MKRIREKINNFIDKFRKWNTTRINNQVINRTKKIREKIIRKYPELAVREYNGNETHHLPLFEQAKAYNQFEQIKSQKLHNILIIFLTIVTIFTAIWFNVNPPMMKPNIYLSTNFEDNHIYFSKIPQTDFLLYIYNGGTGPCVNMKLHYKDFLIHSIRPQKVFRQYTDIKDEVKDTFNSTAFLCSGDCPVGILTPGEVLVVDFRRMNDLSSSPPIFDITVTCGTGQSSTITLFQK